MLFEEFVPLEYREQLAVKSSSRRRLPSLFSSQGKKQWKQAATLNGRPYVVGHVPQSPSFREVEFEGMLHASSSTKQLSLTARNSTRAPPLLGLPSSPAPPLPTVRKVPSRSRFMESPRQEALAPPLPAPKSDEMHSDSTASPSVKKSLFRLPPTPGSNRRSMVPAEYSTVEFETRMASYSDDDQEGGAATEPDHVRQKRRESNADAWVDILVGTQTRRFGGQDAEFVDKKHANRSTDPESASLEVAQVLAAVQNRSLSPESVMGRVDQDYGLDSHIDDLDIDEVEVAPRGDALSDSGAGESDDGGLAYDESSVGHGQLDADGVPVGMSALQMAQHQRRLGYFDLHPERRPAQTQSVAEDPRAKLAASNSDSDDDGDDDTPVPVRLPADVRPLPRPPMVPAVPPKEPPALALIEPTPLVLAKAAGAGQKPEVRTARTASPPSNAQAVPVTAAATPSKTAALIEMYRERERGTPPKPLSSASASPVPIVIAPLAPSRLPVRSASLPKETASIPPTLAVPAIAPSPKSSPESFLDPVPELIDLPRITLEETGRSSPARYIHGAPLQNVIEEEEE